MGRMGCLVLAGAAVVAAQPALATSGATAVSPGAPERRVVVEGRCPTFSWGGVEGAAGYELLVYRVGENARREASEEPVLRQRIAAAATTWTPSSALCLVPGEAYAWMVRADEAGSGGGWSDPLLFEIGRTPSAVEVREALEVLRRWVAVSGSGEAAVLSTKLLPGAALGFKATVETAASLATGPAESALHVQGPESFPGGLTDGKYDIELAGLGEIFSSGTMNLYSNANVYVDLDDDNNNTNASFDVYSGTDGAICRMFENGDLTCGGTKSAVVETAHHGTRRLYAVEATQSWFEDLGTAELSGGEAWIPIDPVFAETVNLDAYKVFLTPVGTPATLFVAEQTPAGFRVAVARGPRTGRLHWRIVAPRLGYESIRLEDVTGSWNTRTAAP